MNLESIFQKIVQSHTDDWIKQDHQYLRNWSQRCSKELRQKMWQPNYFVLRKDPTFGIAFGMIKGRGIWFNWMKWLDPPAIPVYVDLIFDSRTVETKTFHYVGVERLLLPMPTFGAGHYWLSFEDFQLGRLVFELSNSRNPNVSFEDFVCSLGLSVIGVPPEYKDVVERIQSKFRSMYQRQLEREQSLPCLIDSSIHASKIDHQFIALFR